MRKLVAFLSLTLFCTLSAVALADDWPQWLGPQRDSVWRETGIVDEFPKQGPPVRWRPMSLWEYSRR